MKKLIMLTGLLLISLKGISQIDTLNKVTLSEYQAREAIKDLVRGDVCSAELKLTREQLKKREQMLENANKQVSNLSKQRDNLNSVVTEKNKVIKNTNDMIAEKNDELKKVSRSLLFWKIGAGGALALALTAMIVN